MPRMIHSDQDATGRPYLGAKKRYQKLAACAIIRFERVVVQFDCHPEQAFFAQRRIWASRANHGSCPERAQATEGRVWLASFEPTASLLRPAAVIYLSFFRPEEPLALPRSPATPRAPSHAPGSWCRHSRPRIPQSFRRPSPPRRARRQPRTPSPGLPISPPSPNSLAACSFS